MKATAGAIVTIDRNGETVIYRGLLREAEAKALRTLERLRQGFGSAGDEAANDEAADASTVISDRLAQRLSADKGDIVRIERTDGIARRH